jgi:lysophospholipase L1-like esterase
MKLLTHIISIALAATTVLTLAAAPANAAPPKVAVWGDSLAYQMCGEGQQAAPTREYGITDVGCSGYSGATAGGIYRRVVEPGWSDPLISWKPDPRFDVRASWAAADLIIISAGTNNALRQQPPEWMGFDVDNIMQLAGSRRVIFFDVGVRTDVPAPLFNAAQFRSAVAQDDALWAKARQYPNLRVVAWGGEVGAHKEYVKPDGVHLTPQGWAARWRLVQANL